MPKLAKKGKRKRRGKTVKGKSSKLPAKFSNLPDNSDNEDDSDEESEDSGDDDEDEEEEDEEEGEQEETEENAEESEGVGGAEDDEDEAPVAEVVSTAGVGNVDSGVAVGPGRIDAGPVRVLYIDAINIIGDFIIIANDLINFTNEFIKMCCWCCPKPGRSRHSGMAFIVPLSVLEVPRAWSYELPRHQGQGWQINVSWC